MLKYAGWDGIVVEGKAEKPVWIDIRNGEVQIRDAEGRLGPRHARRRRRRSGAACRATATASGSSLGESRDGGRTTQRPAVLTIGPAGETLSRTAALIHDAGNGAGQGGFGGVFGSKNLKAISVIGTGGVDIADPKALMDARSWVAAVRRSPGNIDDYKPAKPPKGMPLAAGPGSGDAACTARSRSRRRRAAWAASRAAARGGKSGKSNGSSCIDLLYYMALGQEGARGASRRRRSTPATSLQRAGINVYELNAAIIWLVTLYKQGILGPGKADRRRTCRSTRSASTEFVEGAHRRDRQPRPTSARTSPTASRAARRSGAATRRTRRPASCRSRSGATRSTTTRAPRSSGATARMLGERDINEHDFNNLCYWLPSLAARGGRGARRLGRGPGRDHGREARCRTTTR